LIRQGYKKPLTEAEMFHLTHRDTCKGAYRRFYRNWTKECHSKR